MTSILATLLVVTALQVAGDTTTVVVSPEAVRLLPGEEARMTAKVFRNGTEISASVRWVTADSDILSLSDEGVVTALVPGTAALAAVANGTAGVASVHVAQPPPTEITLSIPVKTLYEGTSSPLEIDARNRFGSVGAENVSLASSNENVVYVDTAGRLVAAGSGSATVSASSSGGITATVDVIVVDNPFKEFTIEASDSSVRTGDVVRLTVRADGNRTDGLHPSWSIEGSGAIVETEGSEGVFVAEDPGTYVVTAQVGPRIVRNHTLEVAQRAHDMQLVKVGRGGIATHHSGDTWVFEGVDGRDYAYIGTFLHDWMKVWDVTEPTAPVLTDSLRLDARRINDVKIHPNNRLGIVTREGASDRKNGIVLLDLANPAHPTILSEYKKTVTGGVHNVWIDGEHELVYACHNGTNELHIIDISDPAAPTEVGRWGLDKKNKTLHDVIVQEGYAYLSYWDDGVVMLDVGAGTHGGTPTEPGFVNSLKYPAGNTHVAWRHGRYLFVGDEIFPPGWDPELPIEASGYIHVLDMTDMDNPVEVARYEVPEAGAHNIWAEGDKLYVGYYQGGLRVLDISGELRGDLYRQGREIAVLKTTDAMTTVPNWPMTWGAQIHKGNIYTSDLNSGLWIAKLVPNPPVP